MSAAADLPFLYGMTLLPFSQLFEYKTSLQNAIYSFKEVETIFEFYYFHIAADVSTICFRVINLFFHYY